MTLKVMILFLALHGIALAGESNDCVFIGYKSGENNVGNHNIFVGDYVTGDTPDASYLIRIGTKINGKMVYIVDKKISPKEWVDVTPRLRTMLFHLKSAVKEMEYI